MTKLVRFALVSALYLTSTLALAKEVPFLVRPYILRKASDVLHIKFSLTEETILKFGMQSQKTQNGFRFKAKFLSDRLYEVNLGKQECNDQLKYSLVDDKEEQPLFQSITSVPCAKSEELNFIFIADTQRNPLQHEHLAKSFFPLLQKIRPSFVINGGDIVNNGSKEHEWTDYLQGSVSYSSYIPLVPVLGNHEYYGHDDKNPIPGFFRDYMMGLEEDNLGQYALKYEHFWLLVLNSNFDKLSQREYAEQKSWFEKQLLEAKRLNRSVIVTFHHSPITSNGFKYEPISFKLREEWIPLMEDSGVVKLVLNGHSHLYERSLRNGITFLVAGPFGGRLNPLPHFPNPYQQVIIPEIYTLTHISVKNHLLTLTTYSEKVQIVDQYQIELN